MKNGCNKKIIYSCDARRFDKDHCSFYEYSVTDNCRHKYGGRCISSEAQKHADGRGSEYPKPTEPGWYYYDNEVVEVVNCGCQEIILVAVFVGDEDTYQLDELPGTWGPRVPELEPDDE